LDYYDLKSRKDDAVRKPMPEEFYRKLGMEHVEDQGPEKEEEEMTFASRTTEADEANDTKCASSPIRTSAILMPWP